METFCAHLPDLRTNAGFADMDSATTVWQMNWVTGIIDSDSMLNKDGRIWASIDLSDVTGTIRARMPEAIALKLSAATDTAAFVRSVTDGDPVFPTMLSVKIARKQRTVTSAGTPGNTNAVDGSGADTPGNTHVNYTIIDACEQRKDYVRSKTALELAPLLRHLSTITSAVMPAR